MRSRKGSIHNRHDAEFAHTHKQDKEAGHRNIRIHGTSGDLLSKGEKVVVSGQTFFLTKEARIGYDGQVEVLASPHRDSDTTPHEE